MQSVVTSDGRCIAAENHSLRKDSFIGYNRSQFRPSAVCVPGISPEGLPHMETNMTADSRSIAAENHSLVDSEFNRQARVEAHFLTEERRTQEGDRR